MPQDAIQEEIKDVSADTEIADAQTEKTETEEKQPVISEHARMLEELAAKRSKELYPDKTEEKTTEENKEKAVEKKPEVTPEETKEEEKRKIKVDGEEREVPLSKIMDAGIRAIQKESTADKRLEEATRLLKEASERAAQLPKGDAPKQPEEDTEHRDFIKSTVTALQYGTEEEVEAAVLALEKRISEKAKAGTPQINIAEEVKTQLALSNIHAEISKPYDPDKEDEGGLSDLLGNPILRQAVKDRVDKKIQQGMNGLDVSTYKEAAKEIRTEFRTIFNVKPVNNPGEIVDKDKRVDRKRQITSVNVAAGKVEAKPPEKKLTPSEIVEKLAKDRGQIM